MQNGSYYVHFAGNSRQSMTNELHGGKPFFFFIYGLLNCAVNSSGYLASIDK
jgi:hypothetical protein